MPSYTMFNRDGKPSRASAQMWLGLFENGYGKLFNLGNHMDQKDYLLNDRTVMGANNRFVVCVFNCPNINMISGFSIEQSIRKSDDRSLPLYFVAAVTNETLSRNGFFQTLHEIKADLSGITPARLIKVQAAMDYLSETKTAAPGGLQIDSWPMKWRGF